MRGDVHFSRRFSVDIGLRDIEPIRALHRATHLALGHDLQGVALDQPCHLAVQACWRHIGQYFAQLARGQRSSWEKGLHNAQPNRVQEEIGMAHTPNVLIVANVINSDNNSSVETFEMGMCVSEIALQFTSAAETLVGSLLLPAAGLGPFPAVLLITGSGRLDRNANCRRLKVGVSLQIAIALAQRGIATLRYDKRGVGQSSGNFLSTGLYDNIADAGAALIALAARPEIDAKRLFVLGHSEGALIATALAATNTQLVGVVLLAGFAKTGAETLRWQVQRILPTLSAMQRLLVRLLRIDVAAKAAKVHERLRNSSTDTLRIGLVRINAKWFRELQAHDPSADFRKMRVPVFALTGDKDLQVNPDDLARMTDLVNAPIETHRPPDVTHLLRAEAGPASLRTYKKQAKQPMAPIVLDLLTHWLLGRLT